MRETPRLRLAVAAAVLALALGFVASASAATTSQLLRCQKGIHSRAASFVKAVETALSNCTYKVESCQLEQEIDGQDPTSCLAAASAACSKYSSKVPVYKLLYSDKTLLVCNLPLADVAPFVASLGMSTNAGLCGATTTNDLIDCIFTTAQCSAERTIFTLDPRAQDALTAAGVAGAHPCVAP
jgi:hypothetical protein